MSSSFERIASETLEEVCAPKPSLLKPNDIDGNIAGDQRDLVRLAREHYLTPSRDVAGLRVLRYAKLQHILADPSAWGQINSLGRDNAGFVLDLLQEWLDWAPADYSNRRQAIYLLVRLSNESKQLPRLLYVSDVRIIGEQYIHPWKTGGFADIFKAMHKDAAVVIKRLRMRCTDQADPNLEQKFRREALIWRQLKHAFILPLIGIETTTFEGTGYLPCLVSPLMRHGTLRDYIRSADYAPVRDFYRLLQEAAQGLAYLHSQKVVHGDIKEVNILISDEFHVQLGDFGLVVVGDVTEGRLATTAHATGTRKWMSPELLIHMGARYRVTYADDVYALGCLCYYLFTRDAPFHDLSENQALIEIMVHKKRPSRPTDGSAFGTLMTDALWGMIELCWAHDASVRPTAADVVSQLAAMKAPPVGVLSEDLSKDLIHHLEALIRDDIAVQTVLDILDRALLDSDPSHPAYGKGVRRLRRWCRKFALLPTSCKPISIRTIQLESEQPRYMTSGSDVFYGLYDGSRVAVKFLRGYIISEHSLDDDQKSFRNEVVTWRYLRHPNIVPFLGVCDKSPLCFVSLWMEEGTLLEFMRRHPSEHRTSYMLGAIRGLAFMHSLGVVHGCIKSMNILVDRERRARLADFGLASIRNSAEPTDESVVSDGGDEGAVRYMAPELYDLENVRTDRSDIYALSITIWEIFVLKTPFSHIRGLAALINRVMLGSERPTKPADCENIGFTDDLWDVMQRGWAPRPESRPSLSAFVEVLESQGR